MISTCQKCNSAIFSNDGECEFGCDAPEVHAQFTPGSERPVARCYDCEQGNHAACEFGGCSCECHRKQPVSDNPESREIGTPAQSVHAERTVGSNPASQSPPMWYWGPNKMERAGLHKYDTRFVDFVELQAAEAQNEFLRIDLADAEEKIADAQRALEAVSLRYAKLLEKVADIKRLTETL